MRKLTTNILADPVWSKVAVLSSILFFILVADAILSDWVPVYMQNVLGGPLLMGLVMSFSSLIGLGADFVFPQLLSGTTVRKLVLLAIVTGLVFCFVLLVTTLIPAGDSWWTVLALLLVAMAAWGIYYEFLGFASQQFVAETAGPHQRSSVWAVMGIFKNLAYFLGPILGGVLVTRGDRTVLLVAGLISAVAYIFLLFFKLHNRPVVVEIEHINLKAEMSHWWVLMRHVWPMLLVSLMLGLVDATFWTTGTVLTESLSQKNWWGGLFLPMYTLPSLFVGVFVLRWGIYQGKKKWAETFMFLGGIFLMLLFREGSIFYELTMVLLASTMLSVSYPLVDAVYSDIVFRMGRERKHLMGLSNSMVSMAYIIGPILSGLIASLVGERLTFVVMGLLMSVMAVFLLLVTPRKLKLPQTEIATWG